MLIDSGYEEVRDSLNCDLCIVGSGAAGIALATQFIGSGIDVVLLESGSSEKNDSIDTLNVGTHSGARRQPLESTRRRQLGGTTNLWTGLVAPFSDFDFDRTSIGDLPGWPVESSTMSGYYERALDLLQHPGREFDGSLSGVLEPVSFPFNQYQLNRNYIHYTRQLEFGKLFRSALEEAENVRLILGVTVLEAVLAERSDSVEHLTVATFQKRRLSVKAKSFVLACGALENVRILLNSSGFAGYSLGNHNDLVGRYLMDHPTSFCGHLAVFSDTDSKFHLPDFNDRQYKYRPVISLPEQLLQDGRPNSSVCFWPEDESPSLVRRLCARLRGFSKNLGAEQEKPSLELKVSTKNAKPNENGSTTNYRIKAVLEQLPEFENRIALGHKKDRFGMPLPHLNWRIGQAELDSLSNLMVNLEAGFAEQGIGAIRCSSWIHQGSGAINRQMIDYNHPMGCTRMSSAEEYGVVDEDCRLYSTKNLYIAGSSIFSTGSIYNPTLTILAFSIRLADHLRDELTPV